MTVHRDGDTALLLQSSDTEGEAEGREASFVIDTKGPTMTGYSIARLTDDDDWSVHKLHILYVWVLSY